MPPYRDLKERFEEKFVPEPNSGCWLWTGADHGDGYGSIYVVRTGRLAHRVAYEIYVGPIPEGLEIDHKCRVPSCVNPDHLEPVTHAENVRRGEVGKRRREKTHCPQGHLYSGPNLQIVEGGRACRTCRREAQRRYAAADPDGYRQKRAHQARLWRARRKAIN